MEILTTVRVDISKESLQEVEKRKIEARNKLKDVNLTFEEYYRLCIQADFSVEETYQKIKDFIAYNIINDKYKTVEIEENIFGVFEDKKLICRVYITENECYIPPDSIQLSKLIDR